MERRKKKIILVVSFIFVFTIVLCAAIVQNRRVGLSNEIISEFCVGREMTDEEIELFINGTCDFQEEYIAVPKEEKIFDEETC